MSGRERFRDLESKSKIRINDCTPRTVITLHELEQVLMQPGRKELKESEDPVGTVTAAIDRCY